MGGGEMKKLADNRGFSLVEPLMIIVIFSIFGFMAFSLVQAGDSADKRVTENFESQSDARVAIAYIQNRICQNDREGAIAVVPNPLGEGNALRIAGGGPAGDYDIWIFWDDGMLLEFYGVGDAQPVREYCFDILRLDGFDVAVEDGGRSIRVTVPYVRSGRTQTVTRLIPLRTVQEGATP
jgi:type II secretory pathway pseudopilin PulG